MPGIRLHAALIAVLVVIAPAYGPRAEDLAEPVPSQGAYEAEKASPDDKALPSASIGDACEKRPPTEDPKTLLDLGKCYADLEPPRWAEASAAYEKARALGSAEAANRLGVIKEQGFGSRRDYAAAMTLYREAADRGLPAAISNVGDLHEYGRGVPKDHAEARRWYERALEKNAPGAMHGIGMQYDHGRGVKRDRLEALRWYRRAAEQDFGPSLSNIGYAYRHGRGVPVDLEQARVWLEKAVKRGDANGMVNLGDLYMDGAGVPVDIDKGIGLIKRAAALKQPYAINNLGFFMQRGKGVPKDAKKAVALFREAAEDDVPEAHINLGMALNGGNGVDKNQAEANRYFLKAAALGYADGGYLYAKNQYRGDGVTENDDEDEEEFERRTKDEARRWFGEAVKAGSKKAVPWLAWMQFKGEGGPTNPGLALTTLELSGPRGQERLLLAYLLRQSLGRLKPDFARARALLEAAAAEGQTEYDTDEPWDDLNALRWSEDSRHDLAEMVEKGLGGSKSIPEARRLYEEASEEGDPRASERMTKVLLDGGLGGKPDPEKARALFDPSLMFLRNDPGLVLRLATLFDKGIGGPKDPKRAALLLLKADMMWQLPIRPKQARPKVLEAIGSASEETRSAMRDELKTLTDKGFPTPASYAPLRKVLGLPIAAAKGEPDGTKRGRRRN